MVAAYGDSTRYVNRRVQIYQESRDNPRATSDFAGWRKNGVDTVTAVKNGLGAAGLSQFIWPTAERYGAKTISTNAAGDAIFASDIYNPFWSIRANCRYMHDIEQLLIATSNSKAKRRLRYDRRFAELCSCAGYNCGEGRLMKLLKKYDAWNDIRIRLPMETRTYAERIVS